MPEWYADEDTELTQEEIEEEEEFSEEPGTPSDADISADNSGKSLFSGADDGMMTPEDAIPSNWNEIMARSATTIQHGFSAYPDGDPLAVYTQNTKPEKGFYDVAMHEYDGW